MHNMRNHVDHLLVAYVNRQLRRKDREQVWLHVTMCAECRATLDREEQLARDIATTMPRIGQPRRGQLARLWPRIWAEFRTPPGKPFSRLLPSYGLVFGVFMFVAFGISSLFGGPVHAIAAPHQAVPTEMNPTNTPAYTDEPLFSAPEASETAQGPRYLLPSPAPHAGVFVASGVVNGAINGAGLGNRR
jgi:hypothetical protein